MADPIQVTASVRVPADAIRFKAVRAGGAGGQNVNKVSSKVELRIDLAAIEGLPEDALVRLRAAQRNRLDGDGLWIIISDRTRDQLKNLDDAREKVAEAIATALIRPIPRRATKPTKGSKERRLDSKKRASAIKRQRSGSMESAGLINGVAMLEPQTYANHRRLEPLQHFVLTPILLITWIATIWQAVKYPSVHSVWVAILGFAILMVALQVRIYALKVQDRVIRLEETLRMERILPEDLKGRTAELSVKQMVGLRFAADAELAHRVREALDEHLDGEAIKKRIQSWRPDTDRV